MTQATLFNTLSQTRLVAVLTDLLSSEQQSSDITPSHKRFGERLGKLVDLSDSFALSDSLYYISKLQVTSPASQSAQDITESVLLAKKTLVQSIGKCFMKGANTRFKFPTPFEGSDLKELENFGPYRRFYLVQQRDMELEVQKIREFTRAALNQQSDSLAKLAALDKAMNDTLLAQTGKLISAIPALLEQHFKNTLAQASDVEALGWVDQFSRELQAVLFAELEFRLLPVIGMIEALNEEVDSLEA